MVQRHFSPSAAPTTRPVRHPNSTICFRYDTRSGSLNRFLPSDPRPHGSACESGPLSDQRLGLTTLTGDSDYRLGLETLTEDFRLKTDDWYTGTGFCERLEREIRRNCGLTWQRGARRYRAKYRRRSTIIALPRHPVHSSGYSGAWRHFRRLPNHAIQRRARTCVPSTRTRPISRAPGIIQ